MMSNSFSVSIVGRSRPVAPRMELKLEPTVKSLPDIGLSLERSGRLLRMLLLSSLDFTSDPSESERGRPAARLQVLGRGGQSQGAGQGSAEQMPARRVSRVRLLRAEPARRSRRKHWSRTRVLLSMPVPSSPMLGKMSESHRASDFVPVTGGPRWTSGENPDAPTPKVTRS